MDVVFAGSTPTPIMPQTKMHHQAGDERLHMQYNKQQCIYMFILHVLLLFPHTDIYTHTHARPHAKRII